LLLIQYLMIKEKIFLKRISVYLEKLIQLNNSLPKEEFIKVSENVIKYNDANDIIKLFYFSKFYNILPILKEHNEGEYFSFKSNDHEGYICKIEDFLVKDYFDSSDTKKNDQINFLRKYSNISDRILNKLYTYFLHGIQNLTQHKILEIGKIFLINDYSENEWENFLLSKLNVEQVLKNSKSNNLNIKLMNHLNERVGFNNEKDKESLNDMNEDLFISQVSGTGNDVILTKTQTNIGNFLSNLGYNFIPEYFREGYTHDYYLPDKDTVIEYDGPTHFYPLQTQLNEESKFRYKTIYTNTNSKIVSIPYFELQRYEAADRTEQFIERKISGNLNIFKSPLFEENYDMFKHISPIENVNLL
jgi:hypothetical protein